MALRTALNPGDVFAGYIIEANLGSGGMGVVYRAQDPELPRSVALKLLHRDLTADDYIRSRFELEAGHAARLEHPNIVPVYRRGREDDQLWIAMQFVDATDVAETLLLDGPLDPDRAVHIVTETANALDYAHGEGVLHRDVKPANILLERARPGRPGRVLLVDFGIAKALAETTHMTKTGMLVASLQYASPEQFDNVELDGRADEYSLGCTLYHLLTGRLPYPGSTMPQLWAGHVKAPIPKPSQARPELSPAFDAVIERALAKERADRYPSCGELAAAAQAALHGPAPIAEPHRSAPTVVSPQPSDIERPDPDKTQPVARPALPPLRPESPPRQEFPVLPPAPSAPVQPESPLLRELPVPPPPPAPRRYDGAATVPAAPPQPPQQQSQVGRWVDRISRVLAHSGLILLIALIGAAMLTWPHDECHYYYSSYYNYGDYVCDRSYGILYLNSHHSKLVERGLWVLTVAVGPVLLSVAAVRWFRWRRTSVRLVRIGVTLLVWYVLVLVVKDPVLWHMMASIALVGAVLLLDGCWRGLSPTKRNVAALLASGSVVIIVRFVGDQMGLDWMFGEGNSALIAGVALIATGIVLAVRRARSRHRT